MAIVREGEGYLAVENVPLLDSSLPIATSLDPLKNNTFRITRFDLKKKKKKEIDLQKRYVIRIRTMKWIEIIIELRRARFTLKKN